MLQQQENYTNATVHMSFLFHPLACFQRFSNTEVMELIGNTDYTTSSLTIYKSINLHLIKTHSLKRHLILTAKDEDKEFSTFLAVCANSEPSSLLRTARPRSHRLGCRYFDGNFF